ncbi:hypothetical protein ACFXTN_041814 [Malus domestica]
MDGKIVWFTAKLAGKQIRLKLVRNTLKRSGYSPARGLEVTCVDERPIRGNPEASRRRDRRENRRIPLDFEPSSALRFSGFPEKQNSVEFRR